MWQICCGINAVNYGSPGVIRSIGLWGTSTKVLYTCMFGVVKPYSALCELHSMTTLDEESYWCVKDLDSRCEKREVPLSKRVIRFLFL